jgi:hypothetical protein|tara:strand:+ start:250 stop:516 length:267 start_codon:yes stop_codon:yes gene_type:complete
MNTYIVKFKNDYGEDRPDEEIEAKWASIGATFLEFAGKPEQEPPINSIFRAINIALIAEWHIKPEAEVPDDQKEAIKESLHGSRIKEH